MPFLKHSVEVNRDRGACRSTDYARYLDWLYSTRLRFTHCKI